MGVEVSTVETLLLVLEWDKMRLSVCAGEGSRRV